jgi:hypothetical protein
MLNAERYKNEILEKSNVVFDFSMSKDKHTIKKCLGVCDDCFFHEAGDHCSNIKVKWLLSEYKESVKLTELEHGILEYLIEKRQYRFVVRERNGIIYAYKSKPKKEADSWGSLSLNNELGLFNNLFQFVKWEDSKPTSIEDVLNNCEVVESDL